MAGMKVNQFFFGIFLVCTASTRAQQWNPSLAQVSEVEASIKLDKLEYWKISKLPSISGYERYYTGIDSSGEKLILGELVLPAVTRGKATIHIVSSRRNFPMIDDGGCSVINLVYSERLKAITSISCNGRG
jgi:hypothetical protein